MKEAQFALCRDPPKVFVKWVPAGYPSDDEFAALSAVRGIRGAVQLLTAPIRSPHGRKVGLVMPRLPRYQLQGLDVPGTRAFLVQLLEVSYWGCFLITHWCGDCTQVLKECAKRGIAHLDLKPEHMRRDAEGKLTVIDWGGACLDVPSTEHWFYGTFGTVSHISELFPC